MRRQVFSIAIVILLVLLAQSTVVTLAEDPSGVSIGFEVAPDGSWKVVELFGQEIVLDPQNFNNIAGVLGLQFVLPAQLLPPELVAMFGQAGIEQLTLVLEGDAARVWLNDLQSPQVRIHLQNAQGLVPELYAQSYAVFLEVLKFVPGTVYVRFSSAPFARPEMGEFAPAGGEVANSVHLAATVNPEGRLLSAGGFTRADVDPILDAAGFVITDLEPPVAAFLAGFNQVSVDVTPSELMLLTDQQPLVELMWDTDGRQVMLEMVQSFVPGLNLKDPQLAPVVDLAETWLADTHVTADLYIAEAPQDTAPKIAIADPVTIAFDQAGSMYVAGVPVGFVDPNVLGLVMGQVQSAGIQQAAVCWDGRDLRWRVNDMQLPYVTADAGWLSKAIQVTGWQPHPIAQKLEGVLAGTAVPVELLADPAATPLGGCGTYQAVAAPEPLMAFDIGAKWNPESAELSLEDIDLPFEAMGMMPLDLAARVRLPAEVAIFVPANLGAVEASVGADGLSANVDDVNIGIRWDSRLLSNLAKVADGFGFGYVIRQVAPLLDMAKIRVNIEKIKAMALAPEEEKVSEAAPAVAKVAAAAPAEEAAKTEEAKAEAAKAEEAKAAPKEEAAPSPEPMVCVLGEGDSLWTCWELFGRTEGTGMTWLDWKNATIQAHGLRENEQGVVIVQPGDTITAVPSQ